MASLSFPADDLDRLMAVMEAAFDPMYGEAWTRRQVEDALLIGNCQYLLIGENGHASGPDEDAVGFALSRTTLDEEELLLFAVMPQYRRRGIGNALLRMFADEAASRAVRRIFLEMRRGNPAERLYCDFGFRPVGERANYYRLATGERIDAITFAYDIR